MRSKTRPSARRIGRAASPGGRSPSPTKGADESSAPSAPRTSARDGHHPPIVAIGASAGGLEALRAFFGALQDNTGAAFVVVQHMAPDRTSVLPELLSKHTALRVAEATQGARLEPDHVYTCPPNRSLRIERGCAHLRPLPLDSTRGRAIDVLFRSLAEQGPERAVGIVMSGFGTDGTLGLEALKAQGGLCLAQDPASAQFDSMPRSAIDSGVVDHILRPEAMPAMLQPYLRHPYVTRALEVQPIVAETAAYLPDILALLRTRTNFDFGVYKRSMVARRVERRMGLHHIVEAPHYVGYLRSHPEELTELANDLRIRVTGFFRDPGAWKELERRVIRSLVEERGRSGPLRVWVPGCATGEEAYTLAMLLLDAAAASASPLEFQIFATDVHRESLDFARAGLYPAAIAQDIDQARLDRFFVREDDSYRVSRRLRDGVLFAMHDAVADPPFGQLDLISCRNLLMYLEREVQRRLVPVFHFALNQAGWLLLGSAESVNEWSALFRPVSTRWRLYRRVGPSRRRATVSGIARIGTGALRLPVVATGSPPGLASLVQEIVLERHVPACVVVDRHFTILCGFGPTREFLAQPTGRFTADLLAWTPVALRPGARLALQTAVRTRRPGSATSEIASPSGMRTVGITVEPLALPTTPEDLFLVVFGELRSPSKRPRARRPEATEPAARQLERQLASARAELQGMLERHEESTEQLNSANEELLSMNEELQSANEELETSKEELQSLNEELAGVNSQLEANVAELRTTGDDLQNLLTSTELAVLFLDPDLRIRRFTKALDHFIRLRSTDVGRPIQDLALRFTDERLLEDARLVFERLVPVEAEVETDPGHWYTRRVLPYRTSEDHVAGVVVTFSDVTLARRSEVKAQHARLYAERIVQTVHEPLLVVDAQLQIQTANEAFCRTFDVSSDAVVGQPFAALGPGPWRDARLAAAIRQVLETRREVNDLVVEHVEGPAEERVFGLALRLMQATGGSSGLVLVAFEDITARVETERRLTDSRQALDVEARLRSNDEERLREALAAGAAERSRSEQHRMTLLRRLIRAQEEERRAIAREIHDDLGQQLTALALELNWLGDRKTGRRRLSAKRLDRLRGMVSDLGRRMHAVAVDLRPAALDHPDFGEVLRSYVKAWSRETSIPADFHATGEARHEFPLELKTAVYRIVQEALTNVLKHANASAVNVLLDERSDLLTVIIEDNGCGFAVDAVQGQAAGDRRIGLIIMQERAALLGGTVSLESAPGRGTTVFVRIPVPPSSDEPADG